MLSSTEQSDQGMQRAEGLCNTQVQNGDRKAEVKHSREQQSSTDSRCEAHLCQ